MRRGTTSWVARPPRWAYSASRSLRTRLKRVTLEPGALMAPPHAHAAEDEVFVVLDGSATVELWSSPRSGGEHEEHAITAGSAITRPAGSQRAHGITAGAGGLTILADGTRVPNDVTSYPRSGKVMLRGVGVIARAERLDWDGEE